MNGEVPLPRPQSLLIVLDVQGTVDPDELKALLDQEPREILRLSEFGAPPYSTDSVPWPLYGNAIEKLTERVREIEREVGRACEIYLGGRAPLALFVHLGFNLQRFGGAQTVIHFDRGAWKLFPVSSPPAQDASRFFTQVVGLEGTKRASGRTAVFIDVGGREPAIDAIQKMIEGTGERIADVVELHSEGAADITPENAAVVADNLVRELTRLPSVFPYSTGPAFFIAGPTVLAFTVGRSLTTSIFPSVWLTHGAPPNYEFVYQLPYASIRAPRALTDDESDREARARVRSDLIASIEQLKSEITVDDLKIENTEIALRLVTRLRALAYEDDEGGEFQLSIAEQRLSFGGHLLEGLRIATPEILKTFARLLVIHELWHVDQEILSSNFQEIGRAGLVLERLDYTADIFAVRTLFEISERLNPTTEVDELRTRLGHLINSVIFGIEAFDRATNPVRIDPLAERRLRRYLIWQLQLARAKTIRTTHDARRLLSSDVAVELAPVSGHLDTRFDKIVDRATSGTEVFVVVDGRLARQPKRPGFDPEPIVEAVRSFNRPFLEEIMTNLVDSHHRVVAPWVV